MWVVCADELKIKYPRCLEDNRKEYSENREANIGCQIFIVLCSVFRKVKAFTAHLFIIL